MTVDRNRKTPVDPVAPVRIPHDRTPPRQPSPAEVERKKRETIDLYAARRRDTPPSSPQARPEAAPPSVSPDVDRALGRLLRAAAGKLWPALLAAALGTGGAVAVRPAAPPDRVDAHGVRLAELEASVAKERGERLAEVERRRVLDEAIACRLRVLASVARRQGYETGFAEELIWLSERLDDGRPKTAPLWRTTERCKPLPTDR